MYGLWTVMDASPGLLATGRRGAFCRCSCGNEGLVRVSDLISGKSSGCRPCKVYSKTTKESVANEIWLQYHRGAVSRNFSFEIEKDDFISLIQSNCFYCGAVPSNRAKRKVDFFTNGVDRKDNTKGYTLENSVACCSMCNRGKHIVDYDEWIRYLDNLVEYRVSMAKLYESRKWLMKKYVEENWSVVEIMEATGASRKTIYNYLNKFGIKK